MREPGRLSDQPESKKKLIKIYAAFNGLAIGSRNPIPHTLDTGERPFFLITAFVSAP